MSSQAIGWGSPCCKRKIFRKSYPTGHNDNRNWHYREPPGGRRVRMSWHLHFPFCSSLFYAWLFAGTRVRNICEMFASDDYGDSWETRKFCHDRFWRPKTRLHQTPKCTKNSRVRMCVHFEPWLGLRPAFLRGRLVHLQPTHYYFDFHKDSKRLWRITSIPLQIDLFSANRPRKTISFLTVF